MAQLDVAVWGASGFAGKELVAILRQHPSVGSIITPKRDEALPAKAIDAAFLALPHGAAAPLAAQLRKAGCKVIDLSGDLRFTTAQEYERWYHQAHPVPELLPVPYGLPELYRREFASSKLIALPGCYPTATLLAAVPLLEAGLVASGSRLSLIHISEPTRQAEISYAVFCLKKK